MLSADFSLNSSLQRFTDVETTVERSKVLYDPQVSRGRHRKAIDEVAGKNSRWQKSRKTIFQLIVSLPTLFSADYKMNGNGERITTPNPAKPAAPKNFKLLHDPMLTGKKEPKLFRFEGIVQGELTSSVVVLDPRSRITALSKRLEPLDLPVPRCEAAQTCKSFCLQ